MTPDQIKTLLAQAKELADQLASDPTSVGDEQLTEMREQIQTARQEIKDAGQVNPETVALLKQLAETRTAVIGEQDSRAAEVAAVNEEAARLLAEMEDPEPPAADSGEGGEDAPVAEAETEQPETVEEVREPALAASANADVARLTAQVGGLVKVLTQGLTAAAKPTPAVEEKPVGRSAARIGTTTPTGAPRDVVTARSYSGTADAKGSPIESSFALAKTLHDKFRTVYQDPFAGRVPIAHVALDYPESRTLGQDAGANFTKIEGVTAQTSLVAAGGLCAPLETLYDVEVIGSAARPVRDALARFQVERGGITYRPNTSAAAAVNGAGQWTMDDDEAVTPDLTGGPTKDCYEVECPGLESEHVWAAYLCLQFSNITTRFDPETTASNIQQGSIAHARLADNLLLSKMAAESKLLTGAPVVGATRDILANVDKISAYYRNRHRIDTALPLTWMAPSWVRFLMRADLARQMAAGDWKDALAPADSLIDSWFSARGVTPVWHMDGIGGTDEVQTVTITGSPTGGTFTLTYDGDTTAPIAYNASAADVESALAALDTLDANDVEVTGSAPEWTVTFGGSDSAGTNVSQMTSTGSFTGGTSPDVSVGTTTGGDGAITVNGVAIPSQTYDNAAAGSAIPSFPGKIDSLLFSPGSWLFLDGGELNLGLVRDHVLNSKNRYRQFMETFEGAAFRGIESLRLVMEVEPNGGTAGTFDPAAITG